MKRYLVFAGNHYHPYGGARDFINAFDDFEEAQKCMNMCKEKISSCHSDYQNRMRLSNYDWAHIFDNEKYIMIS